jgi:hypothetical protein
MPARVPQIPLFASWLLNLGAAVGSQWTESTRWQASQAGQAKACRSPKCRRVTTSADSWPMERPNSCRQHRIHMHSATANAQIQHGLRCPAAGRPIARRPGSCSGSGGSSVVCLVSKVKEGLCSLALGQTTGVLGDTGAVTGQLASLPRPPRPMPTSEGWAGDGAGGEGLGGQSAVHTSTQDQLAFLH